MVGRGRNSLFDTEMVSIKTSPRKSQMPETVNEQFAVDCQIGTQSDLPDIELHSSDFENVSEDEE
jgi:hypothetical protein